MAIVNKTSIREEVERLKQDFDQLCAAGKLSSEIRVVMNSLLIVIELILSVFLEKTTRKSSKNSRLPSSQTAKDESPYQPSPNQVRTKRFADITEP